MDDDFLEDLLETLDRCATAAEKMSEALARQAGAAAALAQNLELLYELERNKLL